MAQSTIEDYKEKIVASFSDPEHNHIIQKIDGKWICSCNGFIFTGHCHHASAEIRKEAIARKDYCAIIMDLRSHAKFRSFDDVMSAFMESRDEEFTFLTSVTLGLALDGPVDADLLHFKTKERFNHDPRIIGTVLGCLKRKGYLQIIGTKQSERNACHHRVISQFTLTELGRKFLNDGGIL